MSRGRGDMRDVELVEVPDETGATTGTTTAHRAVPTLLAPSRWTPAVRGRVRTAVGLTVAVVLAATGTSAVVSQRREDARLRALADVPGVLEPLAGPPQELWRTDGWPLSGLHHVDGTLVTVVSARASGLEAVALDQRTGEVAWRTPLPADAGQDAPAECVVPGAPWSDVAPDLDPDRVPVLACVVADEVGTTTEARGLDQYTYPVRMRLLVVDAVTGDLLEDTPVVPPVSLGSVGADLLVGRVDDRGHARVTRAHPRTGQTRWTFTSPDPVPEDQFGQRSMWVHSEGDLVIAHGGTAWALSPTGEVLQTLPGVADPFRGFTQAAAGGRLLARSHAGSDTRTTDLVEVASGRTTTVDGAVVTPFPDDRSMPDLLLLARGDPSGLTAHDSRTGRTLWSVPGHDSGALMVLDGRVIATHGSRVEALDGTTGRVVWSSTAPSGSAGALVTDGRVVLAVTGNGAVGDLVAFDLQDGRQVWSVEMDEQPHLFTADGRLFGYGRTGLIAFGSGARPD